MLLGEREQRVGIHTMKSNTTIPLAIDPYPVLAGLFGYRQEK